MALFTITAHASPFAPIEFSGGSGTPLTINILQDIEYIRTLAGTDTDIAFVFADAGFAFGTYTLVDPISFTLNLTQESYDGLGSGYVSNDISSGDFYFYGNPIGISFSEGDVIHLSAGPYTTSIVYSDAAPPDALLYAFITNTAGVNIATGSVIPETSSYALIFGAISLGYIALKRRKKRSPTSHYMWSLDTLSTDRAHQKRCRLKHLEHCQVMPTNGAVDGTPSVESATLPLLQPAWGASDGTPP